MGPPQISDDEHGTRWITIDRPEIANALRPGDLDVIADAVTTAGLVTKLGIKYTICLCYIHGKCR
jgi:1,4-dihydroxy-2-naphthoyl-CoA synthase